MAESRYGYQRSEPDDHGRQLGYQIVDSEDGEIIAVCRGIWHAQLVTNALNFNHRPQDYDYIFMPGE